MPADPMDAERIGHLQRRLAEAEAHIKASDERIINQRAQIRKLARDLRNLRGWWSFTIKRAEMAEAQLGGYKLYLQSAQKDGERVAELEAQLAEEQNYIAVMEEMAKDRWKQSGRTENCPGPLAAYDSLLFDANAQLAEEREKRRKAVEALVKISKRYIPQDNPGTVAHRMRQDAKNALAVLFEAAQEGKQ